MLFSSAQQFKMDSRNLHSHQLKNNSTTQLHSSDMEIVAAKQILQLFFRRLLIDDSSFIERERKKLHRQNELHC